MPKVSVIIPVYNVKQYLRQCLDSVINQTLKDIEIICVDDGSTDGSEYILDEYAAKDQRIHVFHKTNSGYGHTMNMGLDLATGEYIGIIESDDYAELNMFESLFNKAYELQTDMVKSDFFNYYNFGDYYHCVYNNINADKDIVNIYDDVSIINANASIWSAIYRREFLLTNNIRFNETAGASYQDTSFYVKCLLAASRIGYVRKAFLHYRRDNSGSSVHSKNKIYCICDEYEEIEKYISIHMKDEMIIRSIIQESKFSRYMWNLHRLGIEHKMNFLNHFISEFQEAKNEGILNKIYWSEDLWHELDKMLSDKKMYINNYLNVVQNKYFILTSFWRLLDKASNIYVYGAGAYSRSLMLIMPELYNRINAFIVTKKKYSDEKYLNKRVFSLNECVFDSNKDLILIAVGVKNQYDVRMSLENYGAKNYIVVDAMLRDAISNR